MVTPIWPTPDRPLLALYLVEQVEHLRRAGVEIEVFAFQGGFRRSNYSRAWLELRRRYRLADFDLVHAQFGQSGSIAWPTGRRPLVVTFHGSDLHGVVGRSGSYGLQARVMRWLSRRVARRAAKIIIVSRHLARFLPRGCSYETICCGIEVERFRPVPQAQARARLGMETGVPLVLFGGKPGHPVKRFDLARAVVDRLPEELRVELVVLDGIPRDQVPLYMSACDALLVTSKHEGSPTVVKEALADGLPVVSLPVGDVEERIAGIEGCAICRSESPDALARTLAPILESRTRVAGTDAVAELDHGVITERILEVYRSACDRRTSAFYT